MNRNFVVLIFFFVGWCEQVFEEEDDPSRRSFFSEIISSIADVKFSRYLSPPFFCALFVRQNGGYPPARVLCARAHTHTHTRTRTHTHTHKFKTDTLLGVKLGRGDRRRAHTASATLGFSSAALGFRVEGGGLMLTDCARPLYWCSDWLVWMCWCYHYVHTCMHAYIHSYIRARIHTYVHTYMHACMHAYIHIYILAYIHTYSHTYIHTHTHAYIHTYLHAYIHTHIHTYTHTCIRSFIHTYTLTQRRAAHTALYVCLICMPYMYALHVCLTQRRAAHTVARLHVPQVVGRQHGVQAHPHHL